jgi:hypothetical protein
MHQQSIRGAVTILLLFCASCGSTTLKGTQLPGPPPFDGFPAQGTSDQLDIRATLLEGGQRLELEPERRARFLESQKLLPVAVRVGLNGRSVGLTGYRIDEDTADFRLYLGDGQVLTPKSANQVRAAADGEEDLVSRSSFAFGPVTKNFDAEGPWKLVYFQLPDRHEFDGETRLRFERDGFLRTVDLTQAVLGLDYLVGDNLRRPIYAGLRREE